ncbi:hypothetical protein BLNAU_1053 [Blattamonas nauphoetae]|uniref:Secreted protein n=1 Tax=Blattamonas nauphoetae TaxID=2049346 RepID=A0ABQ9YJQ9_9EUKA|nr:hypothetical protein BLNAU_1053 [Blattamonas nauphoetae]
MRVIVVEVLVSGSAQHVVHVACLFGVSSAAGRVISCSVFDTSHASTLSSPTNVPIHPGIRSGSLTSFRRKQSRVAVLNSSAAGNIPRVRGIFNFDRTVSDTPAVKVASSASFPNTAIWFSISKYFTACLIVSHSASVSVVRCDVSFRMGFE